MSETKTYINYDSIRPGDVVRLKGTPNKYAYVGLAPNGLASVKNRETGSTLIFPIEQLIEPDYLDTSYRQWLSGLYEGLELAGKGYIDRYKEPPSDDPHANGFAAGVKIELEGDNHRTFYPQCVFNDYVRGLEAKK